MAASLTAAVPRLLSSTAARRGSRQAAALSVPRSSSPASRSPPLGRRRASSAVMATYSDPDQKARHAAAVAEDCTRVLDITKVYEPGYLKGARVLITGGNRGVGLDLVKECAKQGAQVVATCRKSSDELDAVPGVQIITGIDVTSADACAKLGTEVGEPLDVVVNNAGYFYEPVEKIDTLNFDEELKMINICAVGPLRVTSALFNAGKLKKGSKVAMITSQGGSIAWRTTQNPEGHDYGHHMSKAAANMAGVLLAQELKHSGVIVTCLHPGFNKTEMTAKYKDAWDEEGAVDPECGAMRVMHEIGLLTPDHAGKFINCEDGLEIPW